MEAPRGVTIVRTAKEATAAMNMLRKLRGRAHAQDVESIDIDVKTQSPVTHGRIICFSVFCGKDVDFGNGPRLWVDTLDGVEVSDFADYFHDEKQQHTAHLWGFDFHVAAGGAGRSTSARRPR